MTSSGLAIATREVAALLGVDEHARRAEARAAAAGELSYRRDGLRTGRGERHDPCVGRRSPGRGAGAALLVGIAASGPLEIVERRCSPNSRGAGRSIAIEPPTTSVSGSPETTARELSSCLGRLVALARKIEAPLLDAGAVTVDAREQPPSWSDAAGSAVIVAVIQSRPP